MNLTENQKLAIESWDQPTAIIAGAGSGKTEVLTQRLLQIINSKKVDLNQILAITFTEKAAAELKWRISKNLSSKQRENLPWAEIGTFSSFCLNQLKEFAPLLGFSNAATVWNEHTVRLAIHKHCRKILLDSLEERRPEALLLIEELEFRHTLFILEELMHFRWHADKVWKQECKTNEKRERELWSATKFLYEKAKKCYTEEKQERQVFDFQDLEILTLQLLSRNSAVKKMLQNRFKQILVDEVQDINDLQRGLLIHLFDPKKNVLCIVGDPKQSIYRFRGANVYGFQSLVDHIVESGGQKVELKENFRSRPGILRFVNHTFNNLFQPSHHSPLEPTKEDTNQPAVSLLPIPGEKKTNSEERRKQEAFVITQAILQKVRKKERPFGDFALLFQSLIDVRHYTQAFQQAGIPYRLHGGSGFLTTQEVSDLLFVLRLMVNLEDRLALAGLMRSPLIGLTDTKITELATTHKKDLGKTLLNLKEAKWLKNLHEGRENLSGANILEEAIHQTGFAPLLSRLDPSKTKLANVEQLIELVRQLEINEEMPLAELTTYFEELKKRKTPIAAAPAVDLSHDCCQLMTVHAAKGLEFPILIFPDLLRGQPAGNNRAFFSREQGIGYSLRETPSPFSRYIPTERTAPLREREKIEEREEKKRLLYVALTRAEEEVIIPLHQEVRRMGLWYGWLQEAIAGYDPLPQLQIVESSKVKEKGGPKDAFNILEIPRWDLDKKNFTVTNLKQEKGDAPLTKLKKYGKKGLTGAKLGDLVHYVLKNLQSIETKGLKALIEKSIFNLEIIAVKKEKEDALNLIQSFLESDIAPPTWDGEHELPFKLKVKGFVISGVVDYAWETNKGWILSDFKTDAKPNPQKYKLQMDVYALALSKALKKPVLETRLLFLKSNKAFIETVSKERLKRTEDYLEKWKPQSA